MRVLTCYFATVWILFCQLQPRENPERPNPRDKYAPALAEEAEKEVQAVQQVERAAKHASEVQNLLSTIDMMK